MCSIWLLEQGWYPVLGVLEISSSQRTGRKLFMIFPLIPMNFQTEIKILRKINQLSFQQPVPQTDVEMHNTRSLKLINKQQDNIVPLRNCRWWTKILIITDENINHNMIHSSTNIVFSKHPKYIVIIQSSTSSWKKEVINFSVLKNSPAEQHLMNEEQLVR